MISNSPDKKVLSKAILIILMFLVADLVKSELVETWGENLDESNSPIYVTQTVISTKDNGIDSLFQSKNNGQSPALVLGVNGGGESRILMEFSFL